jgi:hypothetical protein
VTVLDLDSTSPDDIDMVVAGPNGQNVMLVSDACGENPNTLKEDDWTFDDAAPTFLSDPGPCSSFQQTSFRPSNYLGSAPEPDDLSPDGRQLKPSCPFRLWSSIVASGGGGRIREEPGFAHTAGAGFVSGYHPRIVELTAV